MDKHKHECASTYEMSSLALEQTGHTTNDT